MNELTHLPRPPGEHDPGHQAPLLADLAVGVVAATLGAGVSVVRTVSRVAAPVTRLVWRPVLVPTRYHPATVVAGIARGGQVERELAVRRLAELLDEWVPAIVDELVRRLDLTAVVKDNVRLDEIVETVDLDAAVGRVSIDAVVDRIDLDAVASQIDVEAIVSRVDVDPVVARVDIEAIVDRVDLDAIVARVDLDAVVARVDIDAIIDRIDLVGLVEEVMDAIDLPAIIRESTGSMASETVRGVRMSGITADDAISRAVERALFRRRRPNKPAVDPG